jgi:4-hydroxy-tetrahydrodipicolinate synthase
MAGRFGAVVTAMVTPFRNDHGLDLDAARSLAAHLYERGSDSLVIAGSTGESPTLTHREKLDLFEAVIDAGRAPTTPPRRSSCRARPRSSAPTGSCS